jgi:hypothetical protein
VQAALHPDPDTARSWLERELSRPEYHESLLEQIRNWLGDAWLRLQSAALGASPLSTAAFIVVLAVLVVLVVLVAARVRNDPTRHGQQGALLVDGVMSADEHRRVAEACLGSGDLDVALVEAFRAIATRAVQRGVLEDRPGLTAHELTVGLGPAFPDHADALARASAQFDLVFYGDQPATAADARAVLDLDDALRLAHPARGSSQGAFVGQSSAGSGVR